MKRQTTTAALACAFILGGLAYAQERAPDRTQDQMRAQQYQQDQTRAQQQRDQEYQRSQRETTQVSGTIDDLRIVQTNDRQQHLIVRVQPDDAQRGEFEFVDLGEAREVRGQDIQVDRGADISVQGRQGEINGRSILVAKEVTIDGKQVKLGAQTRQMSRYQDEQQQYEQQRLYRAPGQSVRDFQRQQQAPDRGRAQYQRDQFQQQARQDQMRRQYRDPSMHTGAAQGQMPVIRGEVVSTRDFSIAGVDDKHRLIKVSDARQQGRTWVVDLGPANALQDLDLKEGDRVMIQGEAGRIEGRPVLRAVQVAEVVQLERDFATRTDTQQPTQRLDEMQRERQQSQQDRAQQSAQARQKQQQQQQEQDESMRSRIGKPKTGSETQPTTSPDER